MLMTLSQLCIDMNQVGCLLFMGPESRLESRYAAETEDTACVLHPGVKPHNHVSLHT